MKQLILLMSLLSVISIHPYAFVHGSKSDLDKVRISVVWDNNAKARHCPVKRGNQGRGAEWNWKDIENESKGKIKKGDHVSFLILPGECRGLMLPSDILYQGTIPSDGLFGFIVKRSKDPRTNVDVYTVVPDQEAANEYRPA